MPLTAEQEAFVKKYVTALRSNLYKQNAGRLSKVSHKENGRKTVSFCALGVIGELKVQDQPDKWGWKEEAGNYRGVRSLLNKETGIARMSDLYSKLFAETGLPELEITQQVVQRWNDTCKISFYAIAQQIELALKEYKEKEKGSGV